VPARDDLELIRAQVLRGECSEATPALVAHMKRSPTDAAARSLLADCQRKEGQWAAAVDSYRRVAQRGDPELARRARLLAATVLEEKLGDPGSAVPLLRMYLKEGRAGRSLKSAATARLARCLIATHRDDEARALLDVLRREDPQSPAAAEIRALLERGP
jgi:thioredoxin-like negative regulator of GroEL